MRIDKRATVGVTDRTVSGATRGAAVKRGGVSLAQRISP